MGKPLLILSAILIYTLVIFIGSTSHTFVNWDDPDYITNNLLIRDASPAGLARIVTTPILGMYNPVPFLLYALQYKIWGLEPAAYHWMSLLLHLVATIVLYQFIVRLTKRNEAAALVAVLFAVHPMHVSVVTWASQTKTSLFFIFYLLGLGQYLRYVGRTRERKRLVFAALLFVASVLSKPEAVTFAPMLFLLDYYKGRPVTPRLLFEKVPFFAVALAFGVLTILTHQEARDAVFDVDRTYSLVNLILVANYSVAFYFEKLLVPIGLSSIYPFPANHTWLPLSYYLTIPVVPCLIWLIYRTRQFRRELLFGVLFFAISMLVLIRPVPGGPIAAANRYSYLSYVGLSFVIAQFALYLADGRIACPPPVKKSLAAVLCGFILFCSWIATERIKVWQDSVALFDDVIEKHPRLAIAYIQRGLAKNTAGNAAAAIRDLTTAVELEPRSAIAFHDRGVVWATLKQYDSALSDFDAALRIDPTYANAYYSRGNLRFIKGNAAGAVADYGRAIEHAPAFGKAYFNRAFVRMTQKDTRSAVEDWRRAADLGVPGSLDMIAQASAN